MDKPSPEKPFGSLIDFVRNHLRKAAIIAPILRARPK